MAAARKSLAQSSKPRGRVYATKGSEPECWKLNRCGMSGKVIWQICTMTGLVLALVALRAILS